MKFSQLKINALPFIQNKIIPFGFWLFILSYVFSISGMEIGKVILISASLLLFFKKDYNFKIDWHNIIIFICIIFIAINFLSIFTSEVRGNLSFGSIKRLPMLLSFWLIFILILAGLRWEDVPVSIYPITVAIFISSLYSFITFDGSRSKGFYSNPVSYAKVLIVFFPWVIGMFYFAKSISFQKHIFTKKVILYSAFSLTSLLYLNDLRLNVSRSVVLIIIILMPVILFYFLLPKRAIIFSNSEKSYSA